METFTRNLFEALSISVWEDVPVTIATHLGGETAFVSP